MWVSVDVHALARQSWKRLPWRYRALAFIFRKKEAIIADVIRRIERGES